MGRTLYKSVCLHAHVLCIACALHVQYCVCSCVTHEDDESHTFWLEFLSNKTHEVRRVVTDNLRAHMDERPMKVQGSKHQIFTVPTFVVNPLDGPDVRIVHFGYDVKSLALASCMRIGETCPDRDLPQG